MNDIHIWACLNPHDAMIKNQTENAKHDWREIEKKQVDESPVDMAIVISQGEKFAYNRRRIKDGGGVEETWTEQYCHKGVDGVGKFGRTWEYVRILHELP